MSATESTVEKPPMLEAAAKERLEKQQYRVVGSHSAVKVCGWTKNLLRGRGGCYKLKFYGIKSHQCLQMSTSLSCANRCLFCWRDYKAPVAKEWHWQVDEPKRIFEESLQAQYSLLTGFGGNDEVHEKLYEQSQTVKHVALSLSGEPIIYPRINEFIKLCDERGVSTFMVTNAQYPEKIKRLAPVTQLYLSIDAPNKELLKKVDVPLYGDYWKRYLASLDALRAKPGRTCIRLTMIKGLNMESPDAYAELVARGDPDFVEVKAYMHVGASQLRLTAEHMPLHEEVRDFAKEVLAVLDGYELVAEHIPSRVVLLAKKSFYRNGTWQTWIDFPRYQTLALGDESFTATDYSTATPDGFTGISGKGTPSKEAARAQKASRVARQQERLAKAKNGKGVTLFVDEETPELSLEEEGDAS